MGVGEQIRAIRQAKGLTLEQVTAKLAGERELAPSTLSRYELGRLKLNAEDLPVLAKALGVHPCRFFEEEPASAQRRVAGRGALYAVSGADRMFLEYLRGALGFDAEETDAFVRLIELRRRQQADR